MHDRAVFLDKDGTLIENVPYSVDLKQIKFENGVIEGLRILQKIGFKFIIVSNQSGVGRGFFKKKELKKVQEYLKKYLFQKGIKMNDFFYCFHYKEDCLCRKPKPGLITRASKKLKINLNQSWMIGDILNDIEAGNRAGCKTALIDKEKKLQLMIKGQNNPTYSAENFFDASLFILLTERY